METLKQIQFRSKPNRETLRDDGAFVFHHPPKFMWTQNTEDAVKVCSWSDYHLYIHVPFCKRICTFCTFERQQLQKGNLSAFYQQVNDEMDILLTLDDYSLAQATSVYFGGGTASLLSNEHLISILERFKTNFKVAIDAEVTLECEPGTKSEADFRLLKDGGFNRISIGVQAIQDYHLKNLNRSHNVAISIEMVENAQSAGIDNVHVDLIYGLPGHTLEEWNDTLQRIIELGIQHVSTYQLIIFEHELLHRSITNGQLLCPPNPDVIHEMRLLALECLEQSGLKRYSLTEYSRPGFDCKYVQSNWNGSDYLGIGPGAYSRNGKDLWENEVIHTIYRDSVSGQVRPIGRSYKLSRQEELLRDIAMGLCLLEVEMPTFESQDDKGFSDALRSTIKELSESGLVIQDKDRLLLTDAGIRYATHVMKRFTE